MKITVATQELKRGTAIAKRIAPARTTIPIAQNILLKVVDGIMCLCATDFEKSVEVYVDADCGEDFATVVPVLFADVVASLNTDTVQLEMVNDVLRLVSGNTKVRFKCLPADMFPLIAGAADFSFEIDGTVLKAALEYCAPFASHDASRPTLNSVALYTLDGKLAFMGLDGYRISRNTTDTEAVCEALIPPGSANELSKILGTDIVTVGCGNGRMTFDTGAILFSTQLVNGDGVQSSVEETGMFDTDGRCTVTVDSSALLDAVRRASMFDGMGDGTITFAITNSSIVVSVAGTDGGGDIAVQAEGDAELCLLMCAEYMREALRAFSGDITMHIKGALSTVIITGSDSAFVHALSPRYVK